MNLLTLWRFVSAIMTWLLFFVFFSLDESFSSWFWWVQVLGLLFLVFGLSPWVLRWHGRIILVVVFWLAFWLFFFFFWDFGFLLWPSEWWSAWSWWNLWFWFSLSVGSLFLFSSFFLSSKILFFIERFIVLFLFLSVVHSFFVSQSLYMWAELVLWGTMMMLFIEFLLFTSLRTREDRNISFRKSMFLRWVFVLILAQVFFIFWIIPFFRSAQALKGGGSLLEDQGQGFDISRLLRLEPSIRMGDEIQFFVQMDGPPRRWLLRRAVMPVYHTPEEISFSLRGNRARSAWWEVIEDDFLFRDEMSAELVVPFLWPFSSRRSLIIQNYALLALESNALVTLGELIFLQNQEWERQTSFQAAYQVHSLASLETFPSAYQLPQLSEAERELYTNYGDDPLLHTLALQWTSGLSDPHQQLQALYRELQSGQYRYSWDLWPSSQEQDGSSFSEASSRDDLWHVSSQNLLSVFLFETKRAYASYFAFAFSLLARSLGIPTRLALGFYTIPQTQRLGYYPVRAFQAHVWVEVLDAQEGWLSIDPSFFQSPPGEESVFDLALGTEEDEFYIKELLQNSLQKKEEKPTTSVESLVYLEGFSDDKLQGIWLKILFVVFIFYGILSFAWVWLICFLPCPRCWMALYESTFWLSSQAEKEGISLSIWVKKQGKISQEFVALLDAQKWDPSFRLPLITELRVLFRVAYRELLSSLSWKERLSMRFSLARFFRWAYLLLKRRS